MTSDINFYNELCKFRNDHQELALGIQNGNVMFFVGAGISLGAPTNIETAKELVLKLKDKFGSYDWWSEYFNPSGINAECRFYDTSCQFPRLEEVAELFLLKNDFRLFIDSLMEERVWETKPPNICHKVLSELLIEEVCEGILTTNVDNRIETEHRRLSPRSGPNIISHDDFVSDQRNRNNIYKIHGCLYKCPRRKYDSIWATSQLSSMTWPTGFSFAENHIKRFCQRYHLVFVGYNTPTGYLKKSMHEVTEENDDLMIYCVLPCDFDSVNSEFKQTINLTEDRFIQLRGEDFFSIVRQIFFEEGLNKLIRERTRERMKKYFHGGDEQIFKINISDFNDATDSVKQEILKEDREFFQRFLKEVFQEQYPKDKYVSFRFDGEQMAWLFYWLAVFRINYNEFTFCKSSSRHLIMHKNGQKIPLLIVNGEREKPIDLIYQKLNKKIEEDREFMYDIKNVFIYDAAEYTTQATTPEKIGSGRLIERDTDKITNASATQYFPLTDHEMNRFLREFELAAFKQNLDDQPWRL